MSWILDRASFPEVTPTVGRPSPANTAHSIMKTCAQEESHKQLAAMKLFGYLFILIICERQLKSSISHNVPADLPAVAKRRKARMVPASWFPASASAEVAAACAGPPEPFIRWPSLVSGQCCPAIFSRVCRLRSRHSNGLLLDHCGNHQSC